LRIEAHESITSFARHILQQASNEAEEMGYEVLHGIVDSLWVKKDDMGSLNEYAQRVTERFKIPFELEGVYKWIVFLPSQKDHISPVPNKYYGVFEDGTVKTRGIELRRRDSPRIVKDFQKEALEIFSAANDAYGFKELIPDAVDLLKEYRGRLLSGGARLEELLIDVRITREAKDYRSQGAQKTVIEKIEKAGVKVHPGEAVSYVIVDRLNSEPERRYASIYDYSGSADAKSYTDLLIRALENLTLPFGMDRIKIADELVAGRQMRLTY
jgi:DNA polymerase elongation subunit (family B)